MSKKHKKVCVASNYIEQSLIPVSAIPGCVSISAFSSFVDLPIGIESSPAGLKISAITAETKNYKSIIEKKETNMIK